MLDLKLNKLTIEAYMKADYSGPHLDFVATINPESYALDYKVKMAEGQAQGTSSKQQEFSFTAPDVLQFDFLFDSTGIIGGLPGGNVGGVSLSNIVEQVDYFKKLLLEYQGEIHGPMFLKLAWGTLIFKGRCTALNIAYKLFNPDGTPIRAVCKASFTGSLEENLRVSKENAQSPDLTHYRVVKDGDTLPLLCYNIYGDSKYYLQVAQVNNLTNFREIKQGMELFFPPIAKTTGK